MRKKYRKRGTALLVGLVLAVSQPAASLLPAVPACRIRPEGETRKPFQSPLLLVPVCCLVVRLVLTYRVVSVDPSLTDYYTELLAVVCGGLIGLEREYKRRPAGFRTHILICLGAAMTTLTSQFLYLNLHYYTDMARLGAQVVAGIGFIGAGAIIVTRRRRVKGLTTAAGLWAAAIVGLCLGGGFYEGGIFATALILAAEMFLSKLEYRMLDNAPEVNLYMEYSNKTCLDNVLRLFRDLNLKVLNMEITRSTETETHNACALFTLRLNKRCRVEQLIPKMNATEGVVSVEEL